PGGQVLEVGEGRDEDAVLDAAVRAEPALDPPRGVADELDPSLADGFAHLPWRRRAVLLGVEAGRQPKVALAPRRKPDVATDARDAERPDRVHVVVASDHVPAA